MLTLEDRDRRSLSPKKGGKKNLRDIWRQLLDSNDKEGWGPTDNFYGQVSYVEDQFHLNHNST